MDDPSQRLKNLYKTLSKKASVFIVQAKMREHSFVLSTAVLIGVVGGFGAVGIQYAIQNFQILFWSGKFSLDTIINISWYWKMIIPTCGGLFVGLIIQFYSREAKGHGVPEVMEAIALRNGIIRPRVVLAKLIASAVYIASGGSVGREGPVIQIGSAVGSTLGQFFRVNAKHMRTFVACGAASGIAAAFNAPVAGALFAIEIILGDLAVPQFSPVVIASVSSTVISRHFLGNYPAFRVPTYQLQSPLELLFYIILGIFSAIIALLFIKSLYTSEAFFDKKKLPVWVKTCSGGILIGLIGLVFPQIFGVGYDTIEHALNKPYLWQLAIALVFIKIIATSLSLGSGGSGGIFSPSLFLGAMFGSFFGSILSTFFPDLNIMPGAYALVAMGGVVAAATHGPITAILIIFEMSGEYKIILPLMITCIIATVISTRLHHESIYTLKLKLRGINLYGGHEINVLKSLKVIDAYKSSIKTITESTPFTKIVKDLANGPHTIFYIIDKKSNIIGSISLKEIRQTISDYEHLKHLLIARDIMNPNVVSVSAEENLDDVMKKFGRYNLDELPVISFHNGKHIIGTILRHDVIEIYNRQIFLRDMSGELGGNIKKISEQRTVHVFDKYHLAELEAPMIFWDKSLKEIQLRTKYGSDVILIKKKTKTGYSHSFKPDANYKIAMGDILLIFGEIKSLEILQKL
jgi:CIC family chloride channel protein